MDNARLQGLFSSLAAMNQHGDLPVQAYSMMASEHSAETLAEHMRIKWLSDGRFAKIAANILRHFNETTKSDFTLSSCILALLLDDHRNRLGLRNDSKLMYRNSVKTLFAMYPVYMKMDGYLSKSFVKPLFSSLELLIDDEPDSEDLLTAGNLLCENGRTLNEINSLLIDQLIVKLRNKLVSDDSAVNVRIRSIFLHVYDLWAFGWNPLNVPECLDTIRAHEHLDLTTLTGRKQVPAVRLSLENKESVI